MEQHTAPDQLCQVLQQTADVLTDLRKIEQQKADAAASKQHQLLDGLIRSQQALILKLRGLEQHRKKLMDELGFQGLTFRQALAQSDPELSRLLSPHFTALTQAARQLKETKEASDQILKVRLRELSFLTAGAQGISYESNGGITPQLAPHFKNTYG